MPSKPGLRLTTKTLLAKGLLPQLPLAQRRKGLIWATNQGRPHLALLPPFGQHTGARLSCGDISGTRTVEGH